MLDLRGRSRIAPILDPIAVGLSKARFTPTFVTMLGLVTGFPAWRTLREDDGLSVAAAKDAMAFAVAKLVGR